MTPAQAWQHLAKAAPPSAQPDSFDGVIILPSGKLGIYASAERAFKLMAKSKTLFLRGGRVFQLVSEGGLFKLDVVGEQNFRSRIERHGKVAAYRVGPHGEELLKFDARCSLDTAAAWLACDAKSLLPAIAAVHNCPIITEAERGEIEVISEGYHQTCGGRLVTGGRTPENVDLSVAVELLLDSVAEYDFASPADQSRAIACLITPALRFGGLLRNAHVPLFVVEADGSQSGKGFFLEQVQTTYRETPSLIAQRQGGVGGFDESLAQAMIDGRPFIQFDNVRGRIRSTYVEAVLTCPLEGTVAARVPYKGEVQVRPDRFIFQLTSNGFESTQDLINRSCIVRIRKRPGFLFPRYPEGGLRSVRLAELSTGKDARMPRPRRQIALKSARHRLFAMRAVYKCCARGGRTFGTTIPPIVEAYLLSYSGCRNRAAARASASRLMQHPRVRAAMQWFYASFSREIPGEEPMPRTASAIWASWETGLRRELFMITIFKLWLGYRQETARLRLNRRLAPATLSIALWSEASLCRNPASLRR
jgi:hypothetical protein